jgi:alkylation response protein AidB-like acyl-CoA dehydrogenase
MDFAFTEDQEAVRDLAGQIFTDACNHERSRELEDAGAWMDDKLWSELATSNLTAVTVPESCGGSGLGLTECALMLVEAGRHCVPAPLFETLVLGGLPIAKFGNPEQQKRWLGPVVDSGAVLTAALSEHGSSDPSRPKLKATRDGDGWRLDGEKFSVPAVGKASCILVPASIEGGKVGVFLVAGDAAGLEIEEQRSINWQLQGLVKFNGVAVSDADMLGDPDTGAGIVNWIVDHARLGQAALLLGVGEEALQRTAMYLSERKQFGRQIGSFQAVQMRCADAYIDLMGMRSTLWQAVWRVDAGIRSGAEVRAAKWWASRAGDRIVHSAQHLHGGIGSDIDYPIHRYFLWAQYLMSQLGGPSQLLAELGVLLVSDDQRPSL